MEFQQGARYTNQKLYEIANAKYFDVPCNSKQSFLCSTIIGDTDLAITPSNIDKFVDYRQDQERNGTSKEHSNNILI